MGSCSGHDPINTNPHLTRPLQEQDSAPQTPMLGLDRTARTRLGVASSVHTRVPLDLVEVGVFLHLQHLLFSSDCFWPARFM
jgi:hypothetical protein